MVEIPSWVAEYVGVPFKEHGRDRDGIDCWGLVRLILAERFNLMLPSCSEEYEDTKDPVIGELFKAGMEPWHLVPGTPWEGDVGLFRVRGQPIHVGLIVSPGLMVHCEAGIDSAVERYEGVQWAKRLLGIYRHEELDHGE